MKKSREVYIDEWTQSYKEHRRLKRSFANVSIFALGVQSTELVIAANKYYSGDDPKINFAIGIAATGIALVTGIKAINHRHEENVLIEEASKPSSEFIEE